MQNSFYYCERNSLHFLAEPLNFFTNLLFIAFSILLLRNKKISIDKKNKHNFEVFLGPYKTIKMIKNDYIALKQINFDEVDIKIYE